jgi:hypothetical protein
MSARAIRPPVVELIRATENQDKKTRGMNTMAVEVKIQGLQCENETIAFQAAEVLCAALRKVIKNSRRS